MVLSNLTEADCEALSLAFRGTHLERPASQIARHLAACAAGARLALVARGPDGAVGYGTLDWQSEHPPFRAAGIPEIRDLNVAPHARRQGIAARLLDAFEARARERSPSVGIGFGLDRDYGAAQRLYVTRGYVPDGNGAYRGTEPVRAGERVVVDDELVLFLVKELV